MAALNGNLGPVASRISSLLGPHCTTCIFLCCFLVHKAGPWVHGYKKKSLYSRFYMLYAFYFTLFHTKAPKYYELPLRNTDTRDIPVLIMW